MTNKDIALKVLEFVGGEKNISNATHCATRLRLVLKDDSKANLQEISKTACFKFAIYVRNVCEPESDTRNITFF